MLSIPLPSISPWLVKRGETQRLYKIRCKKYAQGCTSQDLALGGALRDMLSAHAANLSKMRHARCVRFRARPAGAPGVDPVFVCPSPHPSPHTFSLDKSLVAFHRQHKQQTKADPGVSAASSGQIVQAGLFVSGEAKDNLLKKNTPWLPPTPGKDTPCRSEGTAVSETVSLTTAHSLKGTLASTLGRPLLPISASLTHISADLAEAMRAVGFWQSSVWKQQQKSPWMCALCHGPATLAEADHCGPSACCEIRDMFLQRHPQLARPTQFTKLRQAPVAWLLHNKWFLSTDRAFADAWWTFHTSHHQLRMLCKPCHVQRTQEQRFSKLHTSQPPQLSSPLSSLLGP